MKGSSPSLALGQFGVLLPPPNATTSAAKPGLGCAGGRALAAVGLRACRHHEIFLATLAKQREVFFFAR